MPPPEELARQNIDALLAQCGKGRKEVRDASGYWGLADGHRGLTLPCWSALLGAAGDPAAARNLHVRNYLISLRGGCFAAISPPDFVSKAAPLELRRAVCSYNLPSPTSGRPALGTK